MQRNGVRDHDFQQLRTLNALDGRSTSWDSSVRSGTSSLGMTSCSGVSMISYREYLVNRAVTMRAAIMRINAIAISVRAAPQARPCAPS